MYDVVLCICITVVVLAVLFLIGFFINLKFNNCSFSDSEFRFLQVRLNDLYNRVIFLENELSDIKKSLTSDNKCDNI